MKLATGLMLLAFLCATATVLSSAEEPAVYPLNDAKVTTPFRSTPHPLKLRASMLKTQIHAHIPNDPSTLPVSLSIRCPRLVLLKRRVNAPVYASVPSVPTLAAISQIDRLTGRWDTNGSVSFDA